MTLPVTIGPDLAAMLHAELRSLVDDLGATAANRDCGDALGLRPALTTVLHSARGLQNAVLPAPPTPLPADAELGWVETQQNAVACAPRILLTLEPARAVSALCMAHSEALNQLLAQIQKECPGRRAPPELVRCFAFIMGHLFTEICQPLYRQHPELEPEWLRES